MQFDTIIIGQNILSAIQLKKLSEISNDIACISLQKRTEIKPTPFKIFTYKSLLHPIQALRQNKLIKILKLKAPFLLLASSVEEYKKLNLIDKLFIKLYNIFFVHQITIQIVNEQKSYYKLSYKSYKFSTNRLARSIIKLINKDKYQYLKNVKSFDIKDKNTIVINNDTEIKSDTIFNYGTDISENKKNCVFWFSYPNDEIKLDKSIVKHLDKDTIITITPWFDSIYFELCSKKHFEKPIEYILQSINNENSGLIIDLQKIIEKNGEIRKLENYNSLIYLQKIKGRLSGNDFEFEYNPWKLMEFCDMKYDEAKSILKSSLYFKKLFYKYGSKIEQITYQAYEYWNELKDIDKVWIKAEIWFLITYENCISIEEFINFHTDEWLNPKNIDLEFAKQCFENILENNPDRT